MKGRGPRARLAVLFGLATACAPAPAPREPPRLSLSLRAKGSCGLSPVVFEADCLAALEVRVLEPSGRTLSRHCAPREPREATLADLLSAAEPAVRFGSLTSLGEVVFRVTGIHDKGALAGQGGAATCAAADAPRHWLFWGESQPLDLSALEDADGGPALIVVPIDCRDCAQGCANLASPQCPAALPVSYCVPFSVGLTCARRCDSDEECFEGTIACDDAPGRCDPAVGEPGTGNTGGFCFPCRSSSDCDLGFACVASPGQPEGLCARRCPDSRCLDGAMCKRLGAELRLLEAGLSDAGP